ncbi:RNA-directed DNA polymerase (Reverse transcriptase), Ribonuclease H [Gossypium australe]|uniref:RNA-directed DNA polymerase (Reverse transcriptase), Ribonuclease H n=1 Tax=Gossypium australe TaxID=47621 RepID=A0A5B6WVK7_9ROSI|nr:RNA-directed DNA polymerase (Reverse transcriptase), Ribonuclease H [Gossypium australe]
MGSTKALHITTHCKGYTLPRMLTDNGSALNVLPLSTLNRLPVDSSHMKTCQNIVRAFDGTERRVMGMIEIPFLIGLNTYEVNFLVMDIKPSYNCLLGRPWIHSARAVSSSLHQKLKLVTEGRLVTINLKEDIIASVTSDAPYIAVNEEAIDCSFQSLEFVNTTFIVEGNKIPDMCLEEPQDFEDDRDCNLSPDLLRMIKQDEKQILPYKESVKIDVFAWSYQDMPGLSTNIVVHRLPIREECKSIQQKLRRMRPDILLKIKEEVKKQFDVGFLQVVKYLNPKDNFPLPHIDTLVKNTAGYSLLSFMDGFSDYNQIKMHPEDMEKTTFVTIPGKPLILYLAVFENSMGCVLGQHVESRRKERAIYYLSDPEECSWKLNFDEASKAIGNGIGAVMVSPDGDNYPFTSKLDFDCTNNMAEYEACIIGICVAIECKIKILEVYEDSALVIYQIKGEWETRNPKLINYRRLVLELIKEFDDITFCYLPRDENQIVDALATLASMVKVNKQEDVKSIQMSIYDTPTHCYNIKEKEKDDYPWYHDILQYVKNREYPNQAIENDKRTLMRLANDYVLDGEILYKRRKDQVLLKYVDAVEAKKILEEVHKGVCGTHANGFTMARQITRFGYYWSTMEGDCISYAKRCHKCQIYGDKIHVPHSPLHVMTSPWPFSIWGMDAIGPI